MGVEVADSFSMFPLALVPWLFPSGEGPPKLSLPRSQLRSVASVSLRSCSSGWTSKASQQMSGGWEGVVVGCGCDGEGEGEGEGGGGRRGVREARRESRRSEGRSRGA